MSTSEQYRLAVRPEGEIKDSDFELVTAPVPEPADNECVVGITHVSIDPLLPGRFGRLRQPGMRSQARHISRTPT
jgi:NADPH-dependent curcumin reductase CurA